MWRVYSYPELLFILLVNVLPVPVAFFWAGSPSGFLARLLECMFAGFMLWLAVIFLVVWPRFRH